MRPLAVCLLLVLLSLSARGQGANKKKFGGKDKDYEPASAGGDSDYEGQDESYYEDYEGEKSSSAKTTEKPKLTSPSSHDKDGKAGAPPLFGPRRTRKPFSPKPVERARATLPSFIRHPANPADLTTLRPPTARPSAPAPLAAAKVTAATTRSSGSGGSVIRATTARPNRYKNGDRSRPSTASDNASNDQNRRYGGTGSRAASKNRNTYRPPGSSAN